MSLNQGIRLLCTSTDAKNSTAQEVLFSKPLQWKTFQATKTKNQSVVRSFEGTIAPGRTITPGACQQFRSVLVEGANVQISMFSKRAINIGFRSKGLKMNQKGVKIVFLDQKMSVFFSKKSLAALLPSYR